MKVSDFEMALIKKVCKLISKSSHESIKKNGTFNLCISGGESVKKVILELIKLDLDWDSIRVFLADERCVSINNSHRNDLATHSLLSSNFYSSKAILSQIKAELGPAIGAKEYSKNLSCISKFDLVLLGVGSDGHIASLFPNSKKLYFGNSRAIGISDSPKFPRKRVSISLPFLKKSDLKVLLVFGRGKSEIYKNKNKIIANKINPTHWFISTGGLR
jgi:6-phosphogluconolactonase